jgi:hypothetical protein
MRETHGDGHFMGVGGGLRSGLVFRYEYNEARKVLRLAALKAISSLDMVGETLLKSCWAGF